MKLKFITSEHIKGITPNLNSAKVLNNRITLLDILSIHSGISKSEILKDPNKVDLKQYIKIQNIKILQKLLMLQV